MVYSVYGTRILGNATMYLYYCSIFLYIYICISLYIYIYVYLSIVGFASSALSQRSARHLQRACVGESMGLCFFSAPASNMTKLKQLLFDGCIQHVWFIGWHHEKSKLAWTRKTVSSGTCLAARAQRRNVLNQKIIC